MGGIKASAFATLDDDVRWKFIYREGEEQHFMRVDWASGRSFGSEPVRRVFVWWRFWEYEVKRAKWEHNIQRDLSRPGYAVTDGVFSQLKQCYMIKNNNKILAQLV